MIKLELSEQEAYDLANLVNSGAKAHETGPQGVDQGAHFLRKLNAAVVSAKQSEAEEIAAALAFKKEAAHAAPAEANEAMAGPIPAT